MASDITQQLPRCVKCGLEVFASNLLGGTLAADASLNVCCPGWRLPADQQPAWPYADHRHEIATKDAR